MESAERVDAAAESADAERVDVVPGQAHPALADAAPESASALPEDVPLAQVGAAPESANALPADVPPAPVDAALGSAIAPPADVAQGCAIASHHRPGTIRPNAVQRRDAHHDRAGVFLPGRHRRPWHSR